MKLKYLGILVFIFTSVVSASHPARALSINDPLVKIAIGDGSVKIYNDGDGSVRIFTVGDGSVRILNSGTPVQEGDGSVRVEGAVRIADGSVGIGEIIYEKPGDGSVTISKFSVNYDPSISLWIGGSTLDHDVSFSVIVTTPIAPINFPNVVSGSLTVDLTDGGNDGASISTPSELIKTEVGLPDTGTGIVLGGSCSTVNTCGPYASGHLPGPNPGVNNSWTLFSVATSFTLSSGHDSALLKTFSEINNVPSATPEPGTMLLFSSGVIGLVCSRIRVKNRSDKIGTNKAIQ
jgi:hypothetical protein